MSAGAGGLGRQVGRRVNQNNPRPSPTTQDGEQRSLGTALPCVLNGLCYVIVACFECLNLCSFAVLCCVLCVVVFQVLVHGGEAELSHMLDFVTHNITPHVFAPTQGQASDALTLQPIIKSTHQ